MLLLFLLSLQKTALMEQVAHQVIVMQFILELAKSLKRDPRSCIKPFFTKWVIWNFIQPCSSIYILWCVVDIELYIRIRELSIYAAWHARMRLFWRLTSQHRTACVYVALCAAICKLTNSNVYTNSICTSYSTRIQNGARISLAFPSCLCKQHHQCAF